MKRILVLLSLSAAPLAAQGTDIWLLPLEGTVRAPSVGSAVNVANRVGYDNQPSFSPDGRTLYYTSQRDGQTDIYQYDLTTKATTQFTHTAESEYSAQWMPNGKGISVIRVERDSTQRLWAFSRSGEPLKPVLDSLKPIGYHAWLDATTVFVYVLGARGVPATLQRADATTGATVVVARNIGRTILRASEGSAVYFAGRDSSGWSVHALEAGVDRVVVKLPSARDDFFAVTPDGDVISANGNTLMQYQRAEQKWIELAKFSEPGLQHITRIALSPAGDRLALVGDEPAPPRQ